MMEMKYSVKIEDSRGIREVVRVYATPGTSNRRLAQELREAADCLEGKFRRCVGSCLVCREDCTAV